MAGGGGREVEEAEDACDVLLRDEGGRILERSETAAVRASVLRSEQYLVQQTYFLRSLRQSNRALAAWYMRAAASWALASGLLAASSTKRRHIFVWSTALSLTAFIGLRLAVMIRATTGRSSGIDVPVSAAEGIMARDSNIYQRPIIVSVTRTLRHARRLTFACRLAS